jgi:hypothetical protein
VWIETQQVKRKDVHDQEEVCIVEWILVVLVCFSKNLPKGEIEVPKIYEVCWLHFCMIKLFKQVVFLSNMLDHKLQHVDHQVAVSCGDVKLLLLLLKVLRIHQASYKILSNISMRLSRVVYLGGFLFICPDTLVI